MLIKLVRSIQYAQQKAATLNLLKRMEFTQGGTRANGLMEVFADFLESIAITSHCK